MKKLLNFIVVFLITLPFYGQVQSYYNGLDLTKTGNDLFLELSNRIIDTHSGIPYTGSPVDVWDACKLADEDPDIPTNVLLIYGYDDADGDATTDRTRDKDLQDTGGTTGTWNREHVFSKSLANPSFGTDEPGPGTDVHNLRPADTQRNTSRSNRKFSDGSGIASNSTSDGGWYPGDEWKGDVARIVMYMYTRYHGTGTQVSETNCLPINVGFGTPLTVDSNMIELFLIWNVEDPVSTFEANRNEVLSGIQMNRNPYIDNPYLATIIWGGLAAEDKWNMNDSSDPEAPTAPTNLMASNITDTSATISWDASSDNVGVYDYLVYVNGVYRKSATTTSIDISNLIPSTSYQISIKARDIANNYSEPSTSLPITTLVGPLILFDEDFSNCANSQFFEYSEASNKDWICSTTYGENYSGSYGINGYQEDVASKDWLITSNPINFDTETGEKLSFYTDAAYGTNPLELVYSSDYDGLGNPSDFNWDAVPNIPTLVHDNSSTEVIYAFSDVDINAITGNVYFAFKYYSNGNPTRWTVDSFKITADESDDVDNDGVLNINDSCPNTPTGEIVDANGCSNGQLDDDNDGVQNSLDVCANTPTGEQVNAAGCSESQLDDDADGVMNNADLCPNTLTGEIVDANGCSSGQLDDDNDGVQNSLDVCTNTPNGEQVNATGCSESQLDDDTDGIMNNVDLCSNTPLGEVVNSNGCSSGQLDDDNDGVQNSDDECADTANEETVNATGCAQSQLDDDNDGVMNNVDVCANTPSGEVVNSTGCGASQLDDDNDGVKNDKDKCSNTTTGSTVDATGCFTLSSSNFSITATGETCPNAENGQIVITAQSNLNYTTSIDGVTYSFSTTKTINNLASGTYNICISVTGETYEQCFAVTVEPATIIGAKTSVTSGKASVEIIKGTRPFTVFVNGQESFKTNSSLFSVDVKTGDVLEVKTSVSCEGVYSKTIDSFESVFAYPNPTQGAFEITIPSNQTEVIIELYSVLSQLISVKTYPVVYGKVQLNLTSKPTGVYYIKVNLDKPVTLKIIKQ